MTLEELIETLNALPASARTASVVLLHGDVDDFDVNSVSYDAGRVVIDLELIGDEAGEDEVMEP